MICFYCKDCKTPDISEFGAAICCKYSAANNGAYAQQIEHELPNWQAPNYAPPRKQLDSQYVKIGACQFGGS
jgi:hypothetical protein